jgi:hypothetical protein
MRTRARERLYKQVSMICLVFRSRNAEREREVRRRARAVATLKAFPLFHSMTPEELDHLAANQAIEPRTGRDERGVDILVGDLRMSVGTVVGDR